MATPPNNIITQVQQPGSSPLIQNSDDSNLQVEDEHTYKKSSFLNCLCSCFGTKRKEKKVHDIPISVMPQEGYLLPPLTADMHGKKTLVLDLDETLVHSSFKPVPNPDFIVPVEIEEQVHKVYVCKRPHVDQFLKQLGDKYEIVVFTASLSKYADPVLDLLDIHKVVKHRLFRESCTFYRGNYVKDMNRIGRDIKQSIIIDNSPTSYLFDVDNAVPCESWFCDENDRELLDFIPFFENVLLNVEDVRVTIKEAKMGYNNQ